MEWLDLKHPDWPFEPTDCALCLGNFDGVHRGHRSLIEEMKRQNALREQPLPMGAILFRRPPSLVLGGTPVPQLNTLEEKLELLRDAGLRFVILCDFEKMKDMPPDDFVQKVLIENCRCRLAVCGFNYSYGAKGAGKPDRLAATFGAHPDRTLSVCPQFTDGIHTVSSSLIRKMLEDGHPEDAARLLGRPFFLTGTVSGGKQVGQKMGFPTANLKFPENGLVPAHGVYLSTVRIGRRTFTAISNVGTRPTLENTQEPNCETFIFDFNGNLYGKRLRVFLLRFLREEKKFNSIEALEEQIAKDIRRAKEYL